MATITAKNNGLTTLIGGEALNYAEAHGLTLNKYEDPIEGERTGLTLIEASEIAAEDPSLIYIEVQSYAAIWATGEGAIEFIGSSVAEVQSLIEGAISDFISPDSFKVVPCTEALYTEVDDRGGDISWSELEIDGNTVLCTDEEAGAA